jgi:hypothetical protein
MRMKCSPAARKAAGVNRQAKRRGSRIIVLRGG